MTAIRIAFAVLVVLIGGGLGFASHYTIAEAIGRTAGRECAAVLRGER